MYKIYYSISHDKLPDRTVVIIILLVFFFRFDVQMYDALNRSASFSLEILVDQGPCKNIWRSDENSNYPITWNGGREGTSWITMNHFYSYE